VKVGIGLPVTVAGVTGPRLLEWARLADPDAVREAIRTRAESGMDELVLWPALAGADQVERLAALVG
jgi:hypothetical protein